MFRRLVHVAAAAVLPLSLAACGGDDGDDGAAESSAAESSAAESSAAESSAAESSAAESSAAESSAAESSAAESSAAESGSGDTLTVVDYYTNEPANTLAEEQLSACAAEVGATIEREAVPGDGLIAKVLQMASSNTLPDILMLDNPDVRQIADTGALANLKDFGITADGYAAGPVEAATEGENLYGLQPGANTIAIFYNKDMLDEAGVTPPTNWQELRDSAKALTVGDRYGFAFDATGDYEGTWQFLPAMWSNGGDETDLTSPEVAGALQLWKDLVDDGSASASVVTWSQGDVNDQFLAGKAAMMLNGPWNIASIKEAGINFGVIPFPASTADLSPQAPFGGETWTVPNTGDDALMAKAAKVVECMNNDANQLAWSQAVGVIPTRLSLQEQYIAAVPDMAEFAGLVANTRARTGKLGADWPEAGKVIYTAVQSVLTGQTAPEDAMAEAGA